MAPASSSIALASRSLAKWGLACLVLAGSCVCALEINQASEAELDSIKGMGPAMTRKVLTVRAEKPFDSWKDFIFRVAGIGHAKAQAFSDQGVRVNGQAFRP